MDYRRFNNIENAAPVFAGLRVAQETYKEADKEDQTAKKGLMHAVGAVLELDVSPREGELIADILIELLNQAEKDVRSALSEQLSSLHEVPLRLVLQLANDEIDIAKPILKKSKVLGDYDLLYIIKSKTTEYWQAIAERKALSEQIIDTLADTADFDTALALAENKGIKLTKHASYALSKLATGSDVLSRPLLMREELPKDIIHHLYAHIGEELKKFLAEQTEKEFEPIVVDAVDCVVQSLQAEVKVDEEDEFVPSQEAVVTARYHHQRGLLNTGRMIENLQQGRIKNFVAQFSVYTNLTLPVVIDAIRDKTGKKLALISKANRFLRNDFVALYILLRSHETNDTTFYDVTMVSKATEYFDKFDAEQAKNFLKS